MSKFQGVDFYNIESLLSEEEILVPNTSVNLSTIRSFLIESITEPERFPPSCRAMAEMGLYGARFCQIRLRRIEQRSGRLMMRSWSGATAVSAVLPRCKAD